MAASTFLILPSINPMTWYPIHPPWRMGAIPSLGLATRMLPHLWAKRSSDLLFRARSDYCIDMLVGRIESFQVYKYRMEWLVDAFGHFCWLDDGGWVWMMDMMDDGFLFPVPCFPIVQYFWRDTCMSSLFPRFSGGVLHVTDTGFLVFQVHPLVLFVCTYLESKSVLVSCWA